MVFIVFRHIGEGNLGQVFGVEGVLDRVIQVAVSLQGADRSHGAAAAFFHQLGIGFGSGLHAFGRHALVGAHLLQLFIRGPAVQDIGHRGHSAAQFTCGLCQAGILLHDIAVDLFLGQLHGSELFRNGIIQVEGGRDVGVSVGDQVHGVIAVRAAPDGVSAHLVPQDGNEQLVRDQGTDDIQGIIRFDADLTEGGAIAVELDIAVHRNRFPDRGNRQVINRVLPLFGCDIREEGIHQGSVHRDGSFVAGKGGDSAAAVGEEGLDVLQAGNHRFRFRGHLRFQLFQESVIGSVVQVVIVPASGIADAFLAGIERNIWIVVDGVAHVGFLGSDPFGKGLEIRKLGMEQDFLHQVITGGEIVVQRDPFSNQVSNDVILFRGVAGIHTDGAGHQVAIHQDGQFFLAVGVGVQLAKQAGEQAQVMDILLGKGTGVKVQVHFAHAVHTGHGVHAADAVFTGFVGDGVFADFLGQVCHGDGGQGSDHFGVFIFLGFGMGSVDDRLLFLVRHAGLDLCQLFSQGGILLFLQAGFGVGGGQGIQLGIHIPVGDGGGQQTLGVFIHDIGLVLCGLDIIKGVAGDGVSIRQAVHDGINRFSAFQRQLVVQKLGGHDGIQLNRIKTVLRNLLQGVVDHRAECFGVILVDIVCHKHKGVIRGGQLAAAGEGTGGEGFLQILHEQGTAVAQQLPDVVHGTLLRLVFLQAGADDVVVDGGLVGGIGAFRHSVGNAGDHRLGDPGIAAVSEGEFLLLIGAEGFVQQLQEDGVILKGTVQVSDTVGRMVIGVVVVLQGVPGHLRDRFGLSAVVEGQGGAGEGDQVGIVQSAFPQVHGAGHLAVHGTVQRQGTVHVLHFIAPGFRAVDVFPFLDDRMQAAVRIEIRQGQQLFFGKGCDRITGHRVRGIGVHVGLVGLIDQVEPQSGAGIFRGTGQGAVFKYMGQAGVINRPGGEGQLEGAVGILIGDIEELRTCLLMLKQHQIRADHLKRPDFLDFKAFDYIADGGQTRGFVSVGRSRLRNRGQDADK